MNVLVLHGPSLNLLGERPKDAPHPTLAELNAEIQAHAQELGVSLHVLQSNHEGVLIDALHDQRQWLDGVILNPGAWVATSYALRDAISAINKPTFEVHLEELKKMEPWKRKSVLKDVCAGQIAGRGAGAYLTALERLVARAAQREATKGRKSVGRDLQEGEALERGLAPAKPLASKTLGRRPAAPPPKTSAAKGPGKTLGRAPVAAPALAVVPAATLLPRGTQLGFLTRALVRQKIAERLSGRLSPAGLATWARAQWHEVQRGAPAESGQRDLLEDLLQTLFLAVTPNQPLSDDQLIELMTRLDG